MSIHDLIRERTGLAASYATCGMFSEAARVYRELAGDLDLHMGRVDAWAGMRRAQLETTGMSPDVIAATIAEEDPVNLQGSGPGPIEPRGDA